VQSLAHFLHEQGRSHRSVSGNPCSGTRTR
jgi:hypothetical protein